MTGDIVLAGDVLERHSSEEAKRKLRSDDKYIISPNPDVSVPQGCEPPQ